MDPHFSVFWYFLVLLGTSRDFSGLLGTSRDFSGLLGTSRDFSGLLGTSRDFSGLLGTSRDFSGLLGTSRDFSGLLGTSVLLKSRSTHIPPWLNLTYIQQSRGCMSSLILFLLVVSSTVVFFCLSIFQYRLVESCRQ